jgi:hypothetical protein
MIMLHRPSDKQVHVGYLYQMLSLVLSQNIVELGRNYVFCSINQTIMLPNYFMVH